MFGQVVSVSKQMVSIETVFSFLETKTITDYNMASFCERIVSKETIYHFWETNLLLK